MARHKDPRIGTTVLEKLRIDALLGAGGMGVVYRVHHLVTKHDRALKVLHADIADDERLVKRLIREAGVAGTLRSPHVVETLDVGRLADGSPYVLMELLDGETLADRMERGDLSPEVMIGFVCQACEGIMHAHAANIVHRDLKPDNLFVVPGADGDERIKILDFGISKFQVEPLDDSLTATREGTILGTPHYMAPEQAIGQPDVGPPADIYSLGVILYEGLSGRTPHEASTFPELIVKLHTTPPPPLGEVVPGIDPDLAAIVHEALAIKPADRLPSAEALLRALVPFAESKRVKHLDTLRGVPSAAWRPALLSMANTMVGGGTDDEGPAPSAAAPSAAAPSAAAPAAPSPEAERDAAAVDDATSAEPAPPERGEAAHTIEPGRAGPSTREVIAQAVPRRSWVPWAVAAAVTALVAGAALTLTYGSREVAADATGPTIGPDAVARDAVDPEPEPEPEPTTLQPLTPEAPEEPGAAVLEPAAPRVADPAGPRDTPREPRARPPVPRERTGPPPRYDLARENPYE